MPEWFQQLIGQHDWPALVLGGLWVGLAAFILGLSFLLWTRWGEYHLTSKCVIFSMLAHLLLGFFFATAEVVDNVVVGLVPAPDTTPPIHIEQVRIESPPDDPTEEPARDGRSEGEGPVGEWDRPRSPVVIEESPRAPATPALPEPPPVERTAPELDTELSAASPRPEIPPAETTVPSPLPLAGMPEPKELQAEAPVSPDEPVARAAAADRELLPNPAATRKASSYGTGLPVRAKPGGANEERPGDTSATMSRVSPDIAAAPEDAHVEVPGSALAPSRRSETARREVSRLESSARPLVTPGPLGRETGVSGQEAAKALPGSAPTRRSGPASGTTVQPGPGVSRGVSPGGDGLPLPPAKLATGHRDTESRQTPASPSLVRPGLPGSTRADRSGLRLGTPEIYSNRMKPNRSELAVTRGGSRASEEAVERALGWLAAHQHPDGHWDVDGYQEHCPRPDLCQGTGNQVRDDCAVTGLVLLAFLGAGNTHLEGKHATVVASAINWLLAQQKLDGDLRGTGRMYSQGIATLALSEALGMTGDPVLRGPVERAIEFIVAAQHPISGGWRYSPGQYGDTSIFGWQLMALKSASLAGVPVPESTWQKARAWLILVGSGRARGLACYLPGEPATPAMTAEAMACRQFLGAGPDDPAVREAADYLMDYLPHVSRQNLYYWYYGTIASYQVGGLYWQRWNTVLRDPLISAQRRDGHAAGSWDPHYDPWGREGGRIYSTALATLCLEVYYRYLPLQSLSPEDPTSPPHSSRQGSRIPTTTRQPLRRD